ncbi:hypothetical protein GXW78_05495 [Roseomonas terrae]|uniref:Lipoprotein n=1 Tax=Neoroseomonas terrae TaxID=424799 RepID=A0ABS5EEL5_9PROT|nr:hypothetical protein [Neoroseomonas terrae]MBR0649107.1 hypothetical protein [Neoroseomonas terrae]
MRAAWTPAALVAAMLTLGACETGGVWANVPADNSPDGLACRVEAENDPEAKRIASTMTSGNAAHDEVVRQELLALLPRLYRACMQRRGAIRGGVEPVRRTTF